MALNNVTFEQIAGGLGRLPEGKDHVSAIIINVASPGAWENTLGKRYLSLDQAEADGIVEGDATYGVLHYLIKEFFRMAGPSELYVINSGDGSYDAENIIALTGGELRQAYEYSATSYAGLAAKITSIDTLAQSLATLECPCHFMISVTDEATAISAGLYDLKSSDKDTVSVINFGDGSGAGSALATALGINYIPAGGTVLGMLSRAQVHESIAHVGKYPLSDGTEFSEAVFSDGSNVRTIPVATLTDMDTKGYVFARVYQGQVGTYVSDTHTTALSTSDTAYIENVRTLHKARRELRAVLIPELNSPLTVDSGGKLSPDTIKYFENVSNRPLDIMQNNAELSGFLVTIDPDQNVLATSRLEISVKIQPRGIARQIAVNIGFAVNLN